MYSICLLTSRGVKIATYFPTYCSYGHTGTYCISIDVLLILKVRKNFFFRGENIYWGISKGPRPFWPLNCGQKGQSPLKKSQEMPHYMLCPQNKNNIPHFQNQQNIGIFMSHTPPHTTTPHSTPRHTSTHTPLNTPHNHTVFQ